MVSTDPLVFSVQHFCLHDGPGIRSLVFFKGCPLRCVWCQNVESWSPGAEIAFKPHLCIGCGTCVERCSENALTGIGIRDVHRCRSCFTCIDACPSGAMTLFGRPKSVEGLMDELRPEFPLFRDSGGGVTFTGGEPTLYPQFAGALAGALRSEGISTAMETSGFFGIERTAPLLEQLDLVLFDIKVFDNARHCKLCGTDNAVIKKNLEALAEVSRRGHGPQVWPRLPLVPGMTDGEDNIRDWAGFLRGIGLSSLTIVPFHPMGVSKRTWLGLPEGPALRVPGEPEIEAAIRIFSMAGIQVFGPGEESRN